MQTVNYVVLNHGKLTKDGHHLRGWWFMLFKATFNNISFISWRSVLLVEETGIPGENHRSVASHWQTLSHNVVWSTPRHERGSNFCGDRDWLQPPSSNTLVESWPEMQS